MVTVNQQRAAGSSAARAPVTETRRLRLARKHVPCGLLPLVLRASLTCALALMAAVAAVMWQGVAAATKSATEDCRGRACPCPLDCVSIGVGTSPAPTQTPTATQPPAPVAAGRVEYGEFQAASLGRAVRYAVALPPSYEQKPAARYPLVIFLHGLNNSERDWEAQGIEAKLAELRTSGKVGDFIVAVPYGANSFYLNAKDGTRYEDAIVKDFLPFIDSKYRTMAEPRHRLIDGISMGGYGALLIAFKHPELFAGVAAHSAALFDELPKPPTDPADRRGGYRYQLATKLFGTPPDAAFFQANNPLYLARANADKIKSLKIYFDVGDKDRYGFDVGNRQLDALLTAAGVKHEYHLAPGDHGWTFLAERSEPAFTFVWNAIR